MKGVILAGAMFWVYVLAMTLALRLSPPNVLRARLLVQLFVATLPLAALAYFATPRNLGFLPEQWLDPDPAVDVTFGLFVYSATFFGGILQVYNLADRGFSLRIAMDIHRSPGGCMTADEVVSCYSAGQGIVWMYQKRLNDLQRLKLAELTGDTVKATPAGRKVAERFLWLRQFLRVTA